MRLLVVDESPLLPRVVERLVSEQAEVEVEVAASFGEALRRIRGSTPPQAAIVSLSPARLPWRQFQSLCARAVPPIPVLYESSIHGSAEEAGVATADGQLAFIVVPSSPADLRQAIRDLLECARRAAPRP